MNAILTGDDSKGRCKLPGGAASLRFNTSRNRAKQIQLMHITPRLLPHPHFRFMPLKMSTLGFGVDSMLLFMWHNLSGRTQKGEKHPGIATVKTQIVCVECKNNLQIKD